MASGSGRYCLEKPKSKAVGPGVSADTEKIFHLGDEDQYPLNIQSVSALRVRDADGASRFKWLQQRPLLETQVC